MSDHAAEHARDRRGRHPRAATSSWWILATLAAKFSLETPPPVSNQELNCTCRRSGRARTRSMYSKKASRTYAGSSATPMTAACATYGLPGSSARPYR